MAAKPVARLGDTGSHGGEIISAAPTIFVNNKPIARVGDMYACPKHGNNPIVTGAKSVFGQGKLVAHVGSKTACGATITSGSPDTFVDIPSPGSVLCGTDSIVSADTFDECFQFFDTDTKKPIKNMPYRIECDGVITYSGYTDDEGKTLRVYTESAKNLYVYYGRESKKGEEANG
ncbi:MAG: PAAR domain-containing protein [Desulfovibrio sp.]|jgi:uncharacterized Zn-binding protein involved in type VI secretion|nr:PAAR domain-containing protein [Desulfovibrio sp.]